MIHISFLEFQQTLEFKTRYMDLALLGDAVLSTLIRKILYNRLRIYDLQYKSEFDGKFRANKTMREFCNSNKYFPTTEGKQTADYFEAYFGWLYLNKMDIEMNNMFNTYYEYFYKREKNPAIHLTCPLLQKHYPNFFV